MNPSGSTSDPRALRAQIDQTRQRMDHTIDALGQRFSPRHLADEALGYIRNQTENGNMRKFTNQLTHSADTAVHSVVDTVKANPIPAALIGAGIAYYFYAQRQHDGSSAFTDEGYAGEESYYGQMSESGGSLRERIGEKAGDIKERSREALHQAGEKVQHAGEFVRERAQQVTDRARERAQVVGQRTRQLAQQGRERVVSTIDHHPLESGLACLALGLIAGLALPTSPRVRRRLRPRAEQMRHRAEEFVERGKTVARTAVAAAKNEAQAQGLAPGSSATPPASQPRPGNEQELFGRPQTGSPISQPVTP